MIEKRDWIDPKSKLQQSVLTLRRHGEHISMPTYRWALPCCVCIGHRYSAAAGGDGGDGGGGGGGGDVLLLLLLLLLMRWLISVAQKSVESDLIEMKNKSSQRRNLNYCEVGSPYVARVLKLNFTCTMWLSGPDQTWNKFIGGKVFLAKGKSPFLPSSGGVLGCHCCCCQSLPWLLVPCASRPVTVLSP